MLDPNNPKYSIADSALTYELYVIKEQDLVDSDPTCAGGRPILYYWDSSAANCRGEDANGGVIVGGHKLVTDSTKSTFDTTTGQFTFELKDKTRADIGTNRVFILVLEAGKAVWVSYYYSWLIEIADPCTL